MKIFHLKEHFKQFKTASKDIAAMKLSAITNRGKKKDFIDQRRNLLCSISIM